MTYLVHFYAMKNNRTQRDKYILHENHTAIDFTSKNRSIVS